MIIDIKPRPRKSDIVCPVCGGKLKTKTFTHPLYIGVIVARTECKKCKDEGRSPYVMEVCFREPIIGNQASTLKIKQQAKVIYAEDVKETIGKKWVEIIDDTPMGNYYGSGGEWVECSQADGERREE